MPKFVEMDENVTLNDQMQQGGRPVILINKFTVNPEEVDQLRRAREADAAYFKKQPRFSSSQIRRSALTD